MHVARRILSRVYSAAIARFAGYRPSFRNRTSNRDRTSTAVPYPVANYANPDLYTNPEMFGGEVHCIRCHEPVNIQVGAFYCLTCDAAVCDACLQRAQIVQHFFNDCAVCEQTR